jgi:hypothetical protein
MAAVTSKGSLVVASVLEEEFNFMIFFIADPKTEESKTAY